MNPEDMVKFIKSLNGEQKKQFESIFKTVGETMGVQTTGEESLEINPSEPEPTVTEDFKVTRPDTSKNRKTPVKFKKNKWKDTGEFGDVETPNFEKTPRKSGKPNKRQVECHVCGREFSINENLIYGEFHRCNRCTGR